MKKIICLVWLAVAFCACFNTKYDDSKEKMMRRIQDSLRSDSINQRRNIPDTTLAIYKRTAFCDTIDVVVFDRVKMLTGQEATDYAQRHKLFGNTSKIIVNQDALIETLKLPATATILLLDDGKHPEDTKDLITEINGKDTLRYRLRKPSHIADGLPKEELIQMVVQHRCIIYLKQLPREE